MPKKKLTEEQVKSIRQNKQGLSYPKLAEKYNVHRNTIVLAKYGLTWSNTK